MFEMPILNRAISDNQCPDPGGAVADVELLAATEVCLEIAEFGEILTEETNSCVFCDGTIPEASLDELFTLITCASDD